MTHVHVSFKFLFLRCSPFVRRDPGRAQQLVNARKRKTRLGLNVAVVKKILFFCPGLSVWQISAGAAKSSNAAFRRIRVCSCTVLLLFFVLVKEDVAEG